MNLSRLCRCGHRFEAHDWRAGTECVLCGPLCTRFRWRWWPWMRTLALVALAAVLMGLGAACSSELADDLEAAGWSPQPATA